MKTQFACLLLLLFALSACQGETTPATEPNATGNTTSTAEESGWPDNLPVYDHIVIVMEENKDYKEIVDSPLAPYINNALLPEGASFTEMFGEEHFSQGNYFWFFSGSNQGVGHFDVVPNAENNPNYPFTTGNLATGLLETGHTFCGYSEGLPFAGSDTVKVGNSYARKHVPWISFANVPDSVNQPFTAFPDDFSQLPTVSFVIPDLNHDMHNGPDSLSIPAGDKWLADNLDAYYQWAKDNNSLLIVTFDENDDLRHITGLTNPDPDSCVQVKHECDATEECCIDYRNKVMTVFAGAHIKPGKYAEGKGLTHVNILRTLEAMYGLPRAGKQQPKAEVYGISDDKIVTDIFVPQPE